MTSDSISLIMPTIDWGAVFLRCLQAAITALGRDDQLLVVFDGRPPPPPPLLLASGVTVLYTGERRGPAAARNLGARQATGSILLFVDADVELHTDAVERVRQRLQEDPCLQAIFGSYDDRPVAPGLISQFRNLLHHHTHANQPGAACTFWAGCGAVRRDRFLQLGGFNGDLYRQPCIEDIEFGLRLHDSGGSIQLDPTIQGRHHKQWSLGLMLRTDILQRAIPWSQLLLQRRQIPATLNLSRSAQLSAALSLLLACTPIALVACPALWPGSLLAAAAALAMLLRLNRSLLALLHRRGGLPLASAGAALHLLYLLYSSLSFLAVLLLAIANRPLPRLPWLQTRQHWRDAALYGLLLVLSIATLLPLGKGFFNLVGGHPPDLYERFNEWRLFAQQIYPHHALADESARSLPYFRTTVYLPWALPMFGGLFVWGGLSQGKIIVLATNLLGVALCSAIGIRVLRPWGIAASWLGALAPLAIRGFNQCLYTGQFSAACVGLLSLQWLLLQRRKPIAAGLCWALAMIKPQIALSFAIPMLTHSNRKGLWLGLGLLSGLSIAAMLTTGTHPIGLAISWLNSLDAFVGNAYPNLFAALSRDGHPTLWLASIALLLPLAVGITLHKAWHRLPARATILSLESRDNEQVLALAGLCAIAGSLLFYHRFYDNIMLYPALLWSWLQLLRTPTWGRAALALPITASLCAPLFLITAIPHSLTWQNGIWLLNGVAMGVSLLRAAQQAAQSRPSA
ncbi:MAG: glycosyltransferase family 2 protein [Cyanobium sp.]